MSITVLDPGPLTTVQDAGRVGYAAQGYRSCGAADPARRTSRHHSTKAVFIPADVRTVPFHCAAFWPALC